MTIFSGFAPSNKHDTIPPFSFGSTSNKTTSSVATNSLTDSSSTKVTGFNFGVSTPLTSTSSTTGGFSLNSLSDSTDVNNKNHSLNVGSGFSSNVQKSVSAGSYTFSFKKSSIEPKDMEKERNGNISSNTPSSRTSSCVQHLPDPNKSASDNNTVIHGNDKVCGSSDETFPKKNISSLSTSATGFTFSMPFSPKEKNKENLYPVVESNVDNTAETLDTSNLKKNSNKIDESPDISDSRLCFQAASNSLFFTNADASIKEMNEKNSLTSEFSSKDTARKVSTEIDSKAPTLRAEDVTLDTETREISSTPTITNLNCTSTSKSKVIEPPPEEYHSKTVEQILNSLSSQLESDTVQFLKSAQRVAQYDAVLRDSQRSLSHLTQKVSQLMISQGDVDRSLSSITSYQHELFNTISFLENQVSELFVAQNHLVAEESDIEREEAYTIAQGLETKLSYMEKDINSLMDNLNVAQERAFGGSGSDCSEGMNLVGAMNQQHNELSNMEEKFQLLEMEFSNIYEDISH